MFKLIFPNINYNKTTPKTIPKTIPKTTPKTTLETNCKESINTDKTSAQKILKLIISNPHITITNISKLCDLSIEGVKYHVSNFKKAGIIKYSDSSKSGFWEVMDEKNNFPISNDDNINGTRNGSRNGTRIGTRNGTRNNHENINQNINEIILELIRKNNKISRIEIAKQSGVSIRKLQRILNSIPNIKYIGIGKNGYWLITNDIDNNELK